MGKNNLIKRKQFVEKYKSVLEALKDWQKTCADEISYRRMREDLESMVLTFSKDEQLLFYRFFDLFEFKHRLSSLNQMLGRNLEKISQRKFIGFLGPLGVGKSTISQALIKELKAEFVVREPYKNNPFWGKSQTYPEVMFRSQLYFLFTNIVSDIEAKIGKGMAVSDTSTLTDILMWAHWYHQTGHLADDEYETYIETVALLKPIIPKPDLLIALVPTSIKRLKEGIKQRQKNEPERFGELIFTQPKDKSLAVQTRRVLELVEILRKEWKTPVVLLKVDPICAYKDPLICRKAVYQIRRKS